MIHAEQTDALNESLMAFLMYDIPAAADSEIYPGVLQAS